MAYEIAVDSLANSENGAVDAGASIEPKPQTPARDWEEFRRTWHHFLIEEPPTGEAADCGAAGAMDVDDADAAPTVVSGSDGGDGSVSDCKAMSPVSVAVGSTGVRLPFE